MNPTTVLTLSALLIASWTSIDAKKLHKLAVGGAAAGGAGAIGAGGGFLAGSHIGSRLKNNGGHGHGGHGHGGYGYGGYGHGWRQGVGFGHKHGHNNHHEKVTVKHVYLKQHEHFPFPVLPVLHHAPHHIHEHFNVKKPITHAGLPVSAHQINEKASASVNFPVVFKNHEPVYKGHQVYKKYLKNEGHHFNIHGYQLSLSKRPVPIIIKKHFLLHPSPVVVKPVFIHKPHVKPVIPIVKHEAPAPPAIIKEVGHPVVEAPIIKHGPQVVLPTIKEGPIEAAHLIKHSHPVPVEHFVEHGAPIFQILGPIFDAPLPFIGGVHGIPIGGKPW